MEEKGRKKGIFFLGIGALGLLLTLWTGCGPRSPFEGGDHAWAPCKGRHPFHGKDLPEHVLKRIDDRVQTLNLTELQQQKYAALRLKLKSELIAVQESRRRLMTGVRKEMQKDLPDIHEVAGLVSEHVGVLPGLLDKSMNLFLEFYETLDEKQKVKVVDHLRSRLNRLPFKDAAETSGVPTESGADFTSGSLSEQMAQKKGDRNGELL